MKLIVTGATGLVGSEIIRQCLAKPEVTSVVAVARKAVTAKDPVNASKLKSVVISDYEAYPDDVKTQFAGADACIWTVAVTPFSIGKLQPPEVKRICQTCTIAGFKAMYEAETKKPFRFIYFSAEGTPTDLSKPPAFMAQYQLMRGETEKMVLDLPTKYPESKVCVVHPGVVTNSTSPGRIIVQSLFRFTNIFTRAFPNVDRDQLSAATIELAVNGFPGDSLTNNELVDIGSKALKAGK
ncbi:hypothetical protein NQ176_g6004 [Zarea fungicola]|uniref:Uncharacterized protein n=1 Tax=Zarea fungicola TaxID=93591 RepID=A0ACC1N6V7_9HYPO|nr:hypothetical protein NQ176_g6004 [Lecanicillium fungicola]